jgi:hypothetical protein
MPTPNPETQKRLDALKRKLADLRAEKRRLFPPNLDPLGSPDKFPRGYTPEQVEYHKHLNEQIEACEKQVDELELELYRK